MGAHATPLTLSYRYGQAVIIRSATLLNHCSRIDNLDDNIVIKGGSCQLVVTQHLCGVTCDGGGDRYWGGGGAL